MLHNSFARLLIALVLGLAVVQAGAIGISVAGLELTRAVALALLATAGLTAWWGARVCGAAWAQSTAGEVAPCRPPPSRFAGLVVTAATGLLVAIYLSLWIIAAAYPDLSCDGNAYHIPAIHQWATAGHIHWIVWPGCTDLGFLNGYPKGVETIAYVLATALHSSRWINATNLVFLPLGVLGLAAMCRSLGVSRRLSLLAGCCWIGVPVNLMQAPTAYCDSAFASCAIAWFALTFLLARRGCRGDTPGWRAALPWGAALGLTLAAKGSGLVPGAVGAIGLAMFLVLYRLPGCTLAVRCRSVTRLLLIGMLAAFLTGGYWYLRNWIITGSPFHPVGLSIMGHTVFPGQTVAETIYATANTPPRILGRPLPWQLAHTWLQSLPRGWPTCLAGVDSRLGGIGFLWVAGCVPALVWLLLASHRAKPALRGGRSALLFLAGIMALAFLGTPLCWWARYTCWIYAAGIPPLAWLMQQVMTQPRPQALRPIWASVLLAVLLGETMVGWNMLTTDATGFRRASGGSSTPAATLLYMFPEARGTTLEAMCVEGAAVAVGPLSGRSVPAGSFRSAVLGPLSLPVGARRVVGLEAGVTAADVACLTQAQVWYVIWNSALPLPPALRRAGATVEAIGGFVVVRLRGERVVGSAGQDALPGEPPGRNRNASGDDACLQLKPAS